MIFKTSVARENWETKYRYGNETPLGTFQRVCQAVAEVEKLYGGTEEDVRYWADKYLRMLVNLEEVVEGVEKNAEVYTSPIDGNKYWATGLKSTPGGRITANAGTDYGKATLLNCFINSPVSNAEIRYTKEVPNSDEIIETIINTEQTPDNLTNIFLSLLEAAETLKSEGGYGINFGFIRPRGSLIKGVGIRHPGVVSYMELWDTMSSMIVKGDDDGYKPKLGVDLTQETKENAEKAMPRKGAMMAVLPIWHPDIEEYILAKQEKGRLTKFNISVLVDDAFMEAVEKDEEYELHFNGTTYRVVRAQELYDLIMTATYTRNEPGVLFLDNMNRNNPLIYLGPATASNPCGEIPGSSYLDGYYEPAEYLKPYMANGEGHQIGFTTVCLLASTNLTQYVRENRSFDYEQYEKDVATLTRFMDNVNDIGDVPLPAYEWSLKNIRQFGMGINGLGSTLYMMGITYGSEEALAFTRRINHIKDNASLRATALLAKERGPFPMYDERYLETPYFKNVCTAEEETLELVRKYGVRNAKRLTNPPLGNSSVICDSVSNGIEPVFSHGYERTIVADRWPEGLTQDNVKDVLKQVQVGDAVAWEGEYQGREWYFEPHNRGLCYKEPIRDYGYAWVLEHYPQDVEDDASYLVTAQELRVHSHVKMQAAVQESCDQAVSKCLAEGQVIETGQGPKAIEDILAEKPEKEGFVPAKAGVQVYGPEGNLIPVVQAYYGGEKPCYRITTRHGHVVECSENHKFKTQRGWVKASEIKDTDFIHETAMSYKHGKGGLPLEGGEGDAPRHMTEELAEFLGMLAARGVIAKSGVRLQADDLAYGERFCDLGTELFSIEAVSPEKGTWVFHSEDLATFVGDTLKGTNAFTKQVPEAIVQGSKSEKMAFLRGLTVGGRYEPGECFYIYVGVSEGMKEQVGRLARQMWGTDVRVTSDIGVANLVGTYDTRGLKPYGKFSHILLEGDSNVLVCVSPEDVRGVKQLEGIFEGEAEGTVFVQKATAERLDIAYAQGSFVRFVEDIGEKPVYDIEVGTEEHAYLVEGLVSHNTCNIPNSYPYEDFKDLYHDAWRAGLVGFTTYRDGTMESVLSVGSPAKPTGLLESLKGIEAVPEDAPITEEGVIQSQVSLPDVFVNGPTHTIKREGMKYYMHLSYLPNDDTNPIALWIHSNQVAAGEYVTLNRAYKAVEKLLLEKGVNSVLVAEQVAKHENDPYHERLGKIISMALRHNVALPCVVEALSDIEGDYVATTLTAVRKFISEHIPDGTKVQGAACESCGSSNLVYESGCDRCLDCGSSGC